MNSEVLADLHASIDQTTMCNTELTFSVKVNSMNITAVFVCNVAANETHALVEICLICKGDDSLQFGGFHTQNNDLFFIKSKLKPPPAPAW